MFDKNIQDRFHNKLNLKTTTVTTFSQTEFLSGDKTPIFVHVFNPDLGTREVLVAPHYIPEAIVA
jgi:peptide subunit release factor RF-3